VNSNKKNEFIEKYLFYSALSFTILAVRDGIRPRNKKAPARLAYSEQGLKVRQVQTG